jgi:hypothetical protein
MHRRQQGVDPPAAAVGTTTEIMISSILFLPPRALTMKRLLATSVFLVGFVWLAQAPAQPPGGFKGRGTKPGELKKYDDVIPKNAKTTPGVFTVHRVEDKVYFEVPQSALGRLLLWQAEVARGPAGVSWGGKTLTHSVVRFERRENRIYVWQASFEKRADGKAVQRAVESANQEAILASFAVEAEGKDRSAVINVTSLFLSELPDLSVKGAVMSGGTIDENRSWIEEVKAFPTNIEVRSLLTFRPGAGGFGGRFSGSGASTSGRSATALIHYSLTLLPEKPMLGRHFDPRVGYFTETFEDYAADKTWMVRREYITRYRLEKKDPTAEVSEPVKPIVFYLSPEIPEKWRPYMKKGVEDWKPAFEKAGFKNAILCRDAPDRSEDPNWDPEDARYSVIRWVAEPVQNAMGPHVHDPRSGEVISAHIIFWHDILKLTQEWYFVQCSAQDPRARKLPLPDELIGDLLRYVTAHEVGHTLGLRHNHRASSAYTVEQLRNPDFTAKHGTVASIMAYGRFNYVAQPEDKVKNLIPVIGPYDLFAIEWGYKPIPNAKTAHDELATLDKWAAKQLEQPWLRFGGEDGPAMVDPTVKTENIGSDSLKATELGLKNLDRVLDHLVAATTTQGEDFALLQETYQAIHTHRRNWFNAVALNVGGVVENRTLGARGKETFSRIPRQKQKESVEFLLHYAFTTPTKLLQPSIVNRFRYSGVASDVMSQQSALLRNLLSSSRIRRLMDAEVVCADDCYTVIDLVHDVQNGVFSELAAPHPKVDVIRRALQRAYLDHLKSQLAPPEASPSGPTRSPVFSDFGDLGARDSDFRAVARAALQDLAKKIADVLPRTQDAMTKVHLEDCHNQIEHILSGPKK